MRDLDNADAVAEVRFYDNMREALRQGNLSEPEQRRQALSLSLTAKNQYETLKEMGTYGGGLADFIEENYQRFTVADRADTRATLNNGQMTETPARMSNEEMEEAWAEYQERNRPQMTDEERYRNEDQRLFSAAAAMYPNPRTDIGSFYEFVKNNPNHKKSYMVFKSKGGLPLDILSDTIKHDNSEHNLSIDEWRDALENVDNIEEAIFSARPTSYGNRSYLLKIKTPKRKYGMVVAYVNGHNYVTTLFKTTDKGYEQWVNKTNKKTAVAPAPYPQAGSSSTQRGNVSYGLPTEDIINFLKSNVNKNDIRNNKLFSKDETVRGAYDPEKRVIEIFADARPDTEPELLIS